MLPRRSLARIAAYLLPLRSLARIAACLFAFSTAAALAQAPRANEMPSVVVVPEAARASNHFDAVAATDAYMAEIPADKMARSNGYFEGGYWLILWDFVFTIAISLLLLSTGWSAGMRNLAERMTRFRPLQTVAYWVEYLIAVSVLTFPLTVYEGYIREHKYGLATQTFGSWMGDQLKGLGVGLVLGAVAMAVLFGIVRRLEKTWWIWGAVVSFLFTVVLALIGPVYIVPLFNKVTTLHDPKIVDPILSMARANGIPARDVYQIDASRQSTRMSANVSGFANTMRITLNDNLLRRGSPEEIQAVMGHEMGHYVMNHIYKGLMFALIEIVIFFAALQWLLQWSLQRWGEKWRIRGVGDTAVLPLAVLLITTFGFLSTPIDNTLTRTQEHEADMYGINTSRQPDGMAQAAIHLGEYRKMSPGPIEEWIFFDHPSGRSRIYAAMRWKAENLQLFMAPNSGSAKPLTQPDWEKK